MSKKGNLKQAKALGETAEFVTKQIIGRMAGRHEQNVGQLSRRQPGRQATATVTAVKVRWS
jgi:hypothetical protein